MNFAGSTNDRLSDALRKIFIIQIALMTSSFSTSTTNCGSNPTRIGIFSEFFLKNCALATSSKTFFKNLLLLCSIRL
jgi:hypothetical protein